MCEPTTMMVLSIASTAAGVYAQQQQANAQAAANKQAYENQMTAYRVNQANSQFSRVQEAENLAEKKVANNNAARRAQSTAAVSAGEAGISGLSVDALMAEIGGMAGRDNISAETNYLRRDQAIQTDMTNNWANTASAINKLETPKTPDYLGAALKIGTSYNTWDAQRAKTP